MALLGKCLVFYLKYPIEMQRLYEQGEEPEGIDDLERTMEMVRAVGDAASRQAASFLEECGQIIHEHFGSFARCQIISKNRAMEKNWSVSCGVWLRGKFKPKPGKWKLMAGVDISTKERGLVVPWLWLQGRSAGEEQLLKILGAHRVKGRSEELGWDAGTVALAKIPVLAEDMPGFDVDREPLLSNIKEAIRSISPTDLQVLLTLVNT